MGRSRSWPEASTFEEAIVAGRTADAFAIPQSCLASGRGLVDTEIPKPAKARRILLARVEGNIHTIGLRMIAYAFALDGWVKYLGPNVPTDALVASHQHAG